MSGYIDLSSYADHILEDEDRPLFDEAVETGKAGSLRATYLMIWIACAESLKRRFREAQKRDSTAGRIVGEIETKEGEHKAVDRFVLMKAKEYGFISDSAHIVLNHIYEMRCVYGHPYEEAPALDQVAHAAAMVLEYVLSKPVKLRHGFGNQLLRSLLEEPNFLDDQKAAVASFTKDIIPRIDEGIYAWLLNSYWSELEKVSGDSSMAIFLRRGICFSRTMLIEIGVDIFSEDDWHERSMGFPKTLMPVCSVPEIFTRIGIRAQDSLVGLIIAESSTRASSLRYIERLHTAGALSVRQNDRFIHHLSEMDSSTIRGAGLRTKTCYRELIKAMKSLNWYVQNPAIDLIVSNGAEQAIELDVNQQEDLGRNLLQAAEGRVKSAMNVFEELPRDGTSWPFHVVRGIGLETFTNEENEIRFKDRYLGQVMAAIERLEEEEKGQLLDEITASVDSGNSKAWVDREDFESVIDSLKAYPWASRLVESLEAKAALFSAKEKDV